jgi:hypothetical protein
LSRRRFWRRVAWSVLLAALLLIGIRPAAHTLHHLTTSHRSRVTMDWDVVRISSDRRAVVIRVDECGFDYSGTQVARVGADVRLTVSTRTDESDDDTLTCGRFDEMPMHVVHLGFALPASGRVLASGCPKLECGDDGAT